MTDRAQLLDETAAFIRRFVVITQEQADVLALWVAHTHAIVAAECTPYLRVSSSEPRCGKTRLLEVVELLVRNPVRTADATEAAIFHLVSDQRNPTTLLLDEVDTIFGKGKQREPMRALLNASYRRGASVLRIRGREPVEHEVFSAKIIAGIGDIPATVMDRSIPIVLRRKERDEVVERFHYSDANACGDALRAQLSAAFGPSQETREFLRQLVNAHPDLPAMLNDRQQDSWEPLLAIAQVVGEDWTQRACSAARELHATETDWTITIRED